jgi:hypothetical protein
MAGTIQVFDDSPITCDVVEAVAGGQVVEARAVSGAATQRPCGVAGATSLKVIGIALIDATNAAQAAALVYPLPPSATVAVQGTVAGVTYAANANYGDRLKAAAAGQVTPWVSGTDSAAAIIGYCAESAGVTSGNKGRVRITLA